MNEPEKIKIENAAPVDETLPIDETSPMENELPDQETTDEETDEESMSPKTKTAIIIGLVLLGALALGWYFYHGKTNEETAAATAAADKADVVVSVRTAEAETKTIAADVSAVGTVAAVRQAVVSANMNGQIKEMRLLKDTLVRQGEVLAQIDVRDLQAQRAEAVAALSEAKLNLQSLVKSAIPAAEAQSQKDLADAQAAVNNAQALVNRRKILYEKGGIALKDLQESELTLTNAQDSLRLAQRSAAVRKGATNPIDSATAQTKIQQAEQRINTIDAQMSYAVVRAPLTGFVVEQTAFAGEYATAGAKLLTIADTGDVIVKANFADIVAADVKVGDAVAVFPADLAGEQMSGKVSQISRSSDPQNRTVEIWTNLANGAGRLRVGSSAEVRISTRTQNNAVVVPIAAVSLEASNENSGTVMTVDEENVAHETKVEIGVKTKTEAQITEGLEAGAKVVVEGNYNLPDGTKVEEKPDEEGAAADAEKKDAPTAKPTANDEK